ncbi:MAG: hypothetical protein JXR86_06750 [Spirochaetales bacterium]|nr:hypothetical protein [Spirochaetales bacterium]
MKKIAVLLFSGLFLTGCLNILPFFKYESDVEPVNVHWSISSSGPSYWKIYENHDWGDGEAGFSFDGSRLNVDSFRSGGSTPVFGYLSSLNSESTESFEAMVNYVRLFLNDVTLGASGTTYPQDTNFMTYSSSIGLMSCPIRFSATIDGVDFTDTIDSSRLSSPGSLAVVEFSADSWSSFMQGTGTAVFHNGLPGGLIYFAFEHYSGYVSLFSLKDYTFSQAGAYFGSLEGDYSWVFFPNPVSPDATF